MAFVLTKKFVLLCEGPADHTFFEKLFERRGIGDFDIPRHANMGRNHGKDAIGKMLKALSGDPGGYAKLKGILVVADSGDDTVATFKLICRKIKEDGPFVGPSAFIKPQNTCRVTEQKAGHPPICIMLIPDGRPGALETLCVESVLSRKPWLRECVETYLSCGKIGVLNWRAEKRDKAHMQCIIAALYKKDPNKGLAHAFNLKPVIINLLLQANKWVILGQF